QQITGTCTGCEGELRQPAPWPLGGVATGHPLRVAGGSGAGGVFRQIRPRSRLAVVARACKATRVRGAGRCRVGLAGGLVGAVLTAVTGCGVQPGSGLCTETQLELADVSA